ncbi:protein MAIN-LIKE 2-like [Vicia villosa]|uniref:protein MAIN-LIKE 2-like n=1 Tax=Vicia villosa TaxID=3911 RepID=UPI00273A7708|nr:protein MAIN-LIKE 2-like [Vicia villosa]
MDILKDGVIQKIRNLSKKVRDILVKEAEERFRDAEAQNTTEREAAQKAAEEEVAQKVAAETTVEDAAKALAKKNIKVVASPPQPQEPAGYPGGPSDLSLFVRYEHHGARHLWFGEERGPKKELKVAGHGSKLKERIPHMLPPEIEAVVSSSSLSCLQFTSLTKIDVNLVLAFVERWNIETSSFQMPFGEMTITLDDVAALLHLPIGGLFWHPEEHVTEDMAVELGIQYLGVERGHMARHVRQCRGAYYSLQWLYDTFVEHRAASRDLERLSAYSWASAALVTLYRHLGDASMFSCKQLGGYPTLLQCWIHEYFPTLGRKGENWHPADNQGLPRAMRWSYRQGAMKVDELRPVLDQLTPTDVVWRPFEDHKRHRAFDELSMYRDFLVWGDLHVPYLPNRCLRQFGYRQYIPPSPPADTPSSDDIAVEWIGYDQSVANVIRDTATVRFPFDTATYL